MQQKDKNLLLMLRLKEKYLIRDFHPLILFYSFGFFMMALSFIFLLRLVIMWFTNGYAPELTLLSWLFSVTLCLNSMFFAMWFDYENNRHLNPEGLMGVGQRPDRADKR